MTESVSIVSRLISGVSRSTDSYVRTDVRTDGDSDFPPVDIFPVRYAQESGPELARFEDAAERLPALANRYPVIRTGPREPILWPVRLGVYLRDGSRCQLCGYWIRHGEPNLDHIVPWSAGGPDTSDNLRTLCAPCNERRSNYDHGATGKRVLPVTWWCLDCWTTDHQHHGLLASGWRVQVGLLDPARPTTLAYCANCDGNSHTTVWL